MKKKNYKGVEKRKFFRLNTPLNVQVTILTEEEILRGPKTLKVKSRNISQQGICIETRQVEIDGVHMLSGSPGTEKNRLDLLIELSPDEKPVRATGEVCWYDLSRETEEFMFQVGIVFLNIEQEDKETFENFFKKYREQHQGFFRRLLTRIKGHGLY